MARGQRLCAAIYRMSTVQSVTIHLPAGARPCVATSSCITTMPEDGPALDRSACALESRQGDDPKTATYMCAGCGSRIVGFGPWRNHMKRSKKHKIGGVNGSEGNKKAIGINGPEGHKKAGGHKFQISSDHITHKQAVLPSGGAQKSVDQLFQAAAPSKQAAPGKQTLSTVDDSFTASPKFAGARPGYVFKRGSRGVGYYVDKPAKSLTAGKTWKRDGGLGKQPQLVKAAAATMAARQDEVDDRAAAGSERVGKRWLGAANSSGKRQRKFF